MIGLDLKLQIWDPVDRAANSITSTVEPRTDGTRFGTNKRLVPTSGKARRRRR